TVYRFLCEKVGAWKILWQLAPTSPRTWQEFVHDKQYLHFASVSRGWKNAWGKGRPTVTAAVTADTSISQLLFSIECGLGRSAHACMAMARYGRLDLLQFAQENGFRWDSLTC
ncbi:unnamed protein product, partial [Pylaiella littoralis]